MQSVTDQALALLGQWFALCDNTDRWKNCQSASELVERVGSSELASQQISAAGMQHFFGVHEAVAFALAFAIVVAEFKNGIAR